MAAQDISLTKMSSEEAFQQIFELFKESFHIDTLRSVAAHHSFDGE